MVMSVALFFILIIDDELTALPDKNPAGFQGLSFQQHKPCFAQPVSPFIHLGHTGVRTKLFTVFSEIYASRFSLPCSYPDQGSS